MERPKEKYNEEYDLHYYDDYEADQYMDDLESRLKKVEARMEEARESLETDPDYDTGLINDYGGGNIGWWQDYIRSEIERCNEYWKERIEQALKE